MTTVTVTNNNTVNSSKKVSSPKVGDKITLPSKNENQKKQSDVFTTRAENVVNLALCLHVSADLMQRLKKEGKPTGNGRNHYVLGNLKWLEQNISINWDACSFGVKRQLDDRRYCIDQVNGEYRIGVRESDKVQSGWTGYVIKFDEKHRDLEVVNLEKQTRTTFMLDQARVVHSSLDSAYPEQVATWTEQENGTLCFVCDIVV